MKTRKIKIKELNLWDKNPRFPENYFNKTEEELINFLFSKKGEKEKLKDLAKSIIENINLIPWERLIVWDNGEKFIVLEGNRRLMIYKLLINPKLLKDDKLSSFFKRSQGLIDENLKIECIVTDNLDQGLKYVELKHLETGYKDWGDVEKANFKRRRGRANKEEILKSEIAKKIKKLNIPEKSKQDILGHGFVTTFYRIVATTPAIEYFGYQLSENNLDVNDKYFDDKLKIIIWNVLNKKDFNGNIINSRSLNKYEKIKEYLRRINVKKDLLKLPKEFNPSFATKVDITNNQMKEFISPTEKTGKKVRKTPIHLPGDRLFGRVLSLKKGVVNNLYCAIDKIYEQNKNNHKNLEIVLPIIGMSLRLILDVAAREYFKPDDLKKDNTPYRTFLNEVKKKFRENAEYKNLSTFTLSWIISDVKLENILDHYAHDSIIYTKNDILKISKIIGDILERFFGK